MLYTNGAVESCCEIGITFPNVVPLERPRIGWSENDVIVESFGKAINSNTLFPETTSGIGNYC